MKKGICFLNYICIGFTTLLTVGAQAAIDNQATYVMCRNKKIVRTIRVEEGKSGSCKTIYTKAGVDRVVGTGIRVNSCKNYMKNIEGNLGRANWKCKDVSSARISRSKIIESELSEVKK